MPTSAEFWQGALVGGNIFIVLYYFVYREYGPVQGISQKIRAVQRNMMQGELRDGELHLKAWRARRASAVASYMGAFAIAWVGVMTPGSSMDASYRVAVVAAAALWIFSIAMSFRVKGIFQEISAREREI